MQVKSRSDTWLVVSIFLALACGVAAWPSATGAERVLLRNTVWLVGLVELCSLPIAAFIAFLLARTDVWGKKLAWVLCSSLVFVPLYLHLCGWEAAFGRQGWHTFLFQHTYAIILCV